VTQLNIGIYLLSLIRSRKSNWSHVGSIPIAPTRDTKLVLEEAFGEFYNFVIIISRRIIAKELSLTNIQSSH
jgi:hypothetical protein